MDPTSTLVGFILGACTTVCALVVYVFAYVVSDHDEPPK
jgi:hypothetical protein